ncbi:inovirus-type Gp2 protein [Pseudomonas sp. NPDC007930]|uniref:YagK/YfjJ domain-containing protein n=1 Tax=Pseudomonas sp. NPDC007930 TaxID=3364417 RepID=UPI0036E1EBF3
MVMPIEEIIAEEAHSKSMRVLRDASLPFIKQSMHEKQQGVLECDEEYEARNWLAFRLLPMIHDMVVTKHNLFSMGKDRYDLPRVVVHRMGRRFMNCIKNDIKQAFDTFPNSQFNPYFEVFYKHACYHKLISLDISLFRNTGEHVPDVIHRLNACIADIRSEVNTGDFKVRLKAYRRPIKRHYDTFMAYTSELFARHSRMLVVRVDLSYLQQYRSARYLTGADVCRHRDALIKDLENGRLGPLVGYVCKLEMGQRKGYHIHGLFFFDGSTVRKDMILGKAIGQHWDSVITQGMGSHFNCNARKEMYPKCFLGAVHHTDPVAREGFELYAAYVTKPDELLRLALPGVRAFIRGKLGPRADGPSRGRPRSPVKGETQWPEALV